MTKNKNANKTLGLSLPGLENALPRVESMAEPSVERRLFYVTNASNLRSILASGLIRLRQGWPKYAADFQELTPGFIPLFCGGVPHSQVASQVTKHDRHDLPVIVEFDAKSWDVSNALCVLADGTLENANLSKARESTRMVLLCGVIPLADIRRVHFASVADAKRFNSDCQALANTRAVLLASNGDFATVPDIPPVGVNASTLPATESDVTTAGQIRRTDALGGVLAALTRMPQAGGGSIINAVFPEWPRGTLNNIDPVKTLPANLVSTLTRWLRVEECLMDDAMCSVLCRTLDFLATPQASAGLAVEELLGAIAKEAQRLSEEPQKLLLERIQSIRRSVIYDDSPAALFQKKGSPVLRGLLLFLLDSAYREDRALPRGCAADPQDLLIAEIMRGALNGWSRVPVAMRGAPQAELAVGYAMARLVNLVPGAVRFGERSFTWADDGEALATILRQIASILNDKTSSKELRDLMKGERAQELDLRVKAKRMKGAAGPIVERLLKKNKSGKIATLTFVLTLPLD